MGNDFNYTVALLEDIYDQNECIAGALAFGGCSFADMLHMQQQLSAIADDLTFIITGVDEHRLAQHRKLRAIYI